MRHTLSTALLAGVVLALPAGAQEPAAGGAVVTSEPGRVAAAATIEASAVVTAIDKAARIVTLKGPEGRLVDVVASDEVRNFDQIKVGDKVVARYVEALTLELKKSGGGMQSGGATRERTESGGVERAQPGERPAVAGARTVTIVADVIDVNPKKSTITLRGPKGRVVDLKVRNPDQFKVVKKGDQVEAVYTQAIALAVEPAAKK